MISMNNVCFSYRQKRRNRDILVDLSMQFTPGYDSGRNNYRYP